MILILFVSALWNRSAFANSSCGDSLALFAAIKNLNSPHLESRTKAQQRLIREPREKLKPYAALILKKTLERIAADETPDVRESKEIQDLTLIAITALESSDIEILKTALMNRLNMAGVHQLSNPMLEPADIPALRESIVLILVGLAQNRIIRASR